MTTPRSHREADAPGNHERALSPRDARPVAAVDAALTAALAAHTAAGQRIAVALSGGIDSMVLLDALHSLAPRFALGLSAVHVDHRLSPQAARWSEFCAEACAARDVPLVIHRIVVTRRPGQSLEAAARVARYDKLLASDVDIVALAHHADDQAETLLLQLLRGAGPAGLAAMPRYRQRDARGPALLRPLLELPRATLAACANARGLAWVDDESNADRRHKRNLIRLDVAPVLTQAFAGYPAVLVRIPSLERLDRDELGDLVAEAWLTRAQKRVAKAWLAEQEPR